MAPADIVADALAHALATTDGDHAPSRFCTLRTDLSYALPPEWEGPMPEFFTEPSQTHVAYGRADFTLAALAYAANRASRAEGRAARLRREVCDAIHEYTVSGDTRGIADDLRRAVDEYDADEAVTRISRSDS